ncbi:D-xylose 1-dehydrogenase [Colletotrichum orbiculare MAFF 240422]|uniref:D-xylose 1-dehydrogenase n=1 Tax=Colletotrichum orbiculare (strain 104-T / ATCC 96160 / CBS 514.97 / LARS 414 / MAFF 240422) TaxID=1213857 RepID=N4VGN3_COLOR|nr:D-xylose 1-dehydrogenase [Colletotrichum orbiculare MAFF 240422]
MADGPFVLRWGIMATGAMSEYFCKDLLTNPAVRQTADVAHAVTAVSSSNDRLRAEAFLSRINHPAPSNVATCHNAMLALTAGNHVLCEKALAVTAAQARRLADVARQKRLIRDLVGGGAIGRVYRVTADLSRAANGSPEPGRARLYYEDGHRMVDPNLAGGVLLGLGVYPLTWVFQILYHLQTGEKEEPRVLSAVQRYHTGVDESAAVVVAFPKHGTVGIATSSLRVATDPGGAGNPAVRIQGSGGEIQVEHTAYKPTMFKIIKTGGGEVVEEVEEYPQPQDAERNWGNGTFWEADECARCVRDGRLGSDVMPAEESIVIMETMEKVLVGAHSISGSCF